MSNLTDALDLVQGALQESYNNAYPVCCGKHQVTGCCGNPEPEWSETDTAVMNILSPIHNKLMDALKDNPWVSTKDKLPDNETGLYLCSGHEGFLFLCYRKRHEWIRSPQLKKVVGITHWMKIPSIPEVNDGSLS